MSSMFCYQCEQTAQLTGCTFMGVCGKDPETSALQDLLVHAAKGISMFAHRARKLNRSSERIDLFVLDALFTTVTNVNFDPRRMQQVLLEAAAIKDEARQLYEEACEAASIEKESLNSATQWKPADTLDALINQGERVGIEKRLDLVGHDIGGLQELLLYGIKGLAAYAHHAWVLGYRDSEVAAFIFEALDYLATGKNDVEGLFSLNMKCGEVNLKVLELLDTANTNTYGTPVPTPVNVNPVAGKCILVTGHDLLDLKGLLEQTAGKGINVYTHGEMLPAHGYPELKKYPHLVGNYGGAWQDQREEFEKFPGAILVTTNCIQKPKQSYMGRMFTCGLVAWPEVKHIDDRNFTPVIEAALGADGFPASEAEKTILVGFGHGSVLGVADKVVEAVKGGDIRHFFLIGGCDGAKSGRNYYTDLAESVPEDCVVLTLGCGKYRFNKKEFGAIGGIPRLLDCGQCNDSFSAIKIAVALAEVFECGVNDLPLSLHVSWYEQKAVAVLLTLLYLGVKNIRLGPTLPAFVSPAVLQVLSEKFNLMGTSSVEKDLEACLAQ